MYYEKVLTEQMQLSDLLVGFFDQEEDADINTNDDSTEEDVDIESVDVENENLEEEDSMDSGPDPEFVHERMEALKVLYVQFIELHTQSDDVAALNKAAGNLADYFMQFKLDNRQFKEFVKSAKQINTQIRKTEIKIRDIVCKNCFVDKNIP